MAQTKASRAMQAKLKARPLYFIGATAIVKCGQCLGDRLRFARKVPLYQAWNSSFDTCKECGYTVK